MDKFKIVLFVLIFIGIIGCSTFVRIDSIPSGAKASLNGESIGNTPVHTDLSNFVFNDYDLELKLNGYDIFYRNLSKEVKVGQLIIGLFDWINFLWCYGPKNHYNFELTPRTNQPSSFLINNRTDVIVLLNGERLKEGKNEIDSGIYNITFLKDKDVYNDVSFEIKPNKAYFVN